VRVIFIRQMQPPHVGHTENSRRNGTSLFVCARETQWGVYMLWTVRLIVYLTESLSHKGVAL